MLTGKKDKKKSNNELQNITQKMSVTYPNPTKKPVMNSGVPEG